MVEEIRPRSAPTGPGRLARLLPLVLIIWGFVGVYLLQLTFDGTSKGKMRERLVRELMYFPSGQFLRPAAIEYQTAASDVVWLRAIQYYGHHLMTDRRYDWLGHVFEIVTELDPRFIGAYHFGAITLAWDANQPREAIELLVKGMRANPMNWQLPFDAGFIHYMLLRDYRKAGVFFEIASKLPDAWLVTSRWAAVSVAKAGSYDTAREMWLDIYRSTDNKALRALVLRQIRVLKLEESIDLMQQAADRFYAERERYPYELEELVREGYLEQIPREPYGGRYFIRDDSVRTTTPPGRRD